MFQPPATPQHVQTAHGAFGWKNDCRRCRTYKRQPIIIYIAFSVLDYKEEKSDDDAERVGEIGVGLM
jgi:hypothetical protein